MKFWDFFKRKPKPLNTFNLDDEIDEKEGIKTLKSWKSAITREKTRAMQLQAERMRDLNDQLEMRHNELKIQALEEELAPEEDDDDEGAAVDTPEALLMTLLSKSIGNTPTQQTQQTQNAPNPTPAAANSTPTQQRVQQLLAQGAISETQLNWFRRQNPDVKQKILNEYFPSIPQEEKIQIIKEVV